MIRAPNRRVRIEHQTRQVQLLTRARDKARGAGGPPLAKAERRLDIATAILADLVALAARDKAARWTPARDRIAPSGAAV